jgi:hypothetical protein
MEHQNQDYSGAPGHKLVTAALIVLILIAIASIYMVTTVAP